MLVHHRANPPDDFITQLLRAKVKVLRMVFAQVELHAILADAVPEVRLRADDFAYGKAVLDIPK